MPAAVLATTLATEGKAGSQALQQETIMHASDRTHALGLAVFGGSNFDCVAHRLPECVGQPKRAY